MIDFKPYASHSRGNLCTIDDGHTRLMLDCGLSWPRIQQLLAFQTSSIAGVLLSHFHRDHSAGAKDAIKYGLDIWTSQQTLDQCHLTGSRTHVVAPLSDFRIGSWRVKALEAIHDAEGNLGWLLTNQANESALYIVDTAYVKYRIDGLSVIAVECNHSLELLHEAVAAGDTDRALKSRVMHNHMSLETLLDFLQACGTKRLKAVYLLHMSDRHSDVESFRRAIQEATGAEVYVA